MLKMLHLMFHASLPDHNSIKGHHHAPSIQAWEEYLNIFKLIQIAKRPAMKINEIQLSSLGSFLIHRRRPKSPTFRCWRTIHRHHGPCGCDGVQHGSATNPFTRLSVVSCCFMPFNAAFHAVSNIASHSFSSFQLTVDPANI